MQHTGSFRIFTQDGSWSFAERLLYVDWVDERALS